LLNPASRFKSFPKVYPLSSVMRHTLFIYLISLVLLTRYGLGANPHGMGRSQEVSHTAYYEVFPSLGTDYGDTGAFIMKIVKTDDPKPYTDSNNMIVSWTVEANNNQVDQLLRHPGIKRLARSQLPSSPAETRRRHAAVDGCTD
jgi:hypothetical protein